MNEITSLPASIRTRIERADSLSRQGYQNEANMLLREAGIEMARTHPELVALLAAGQLGYRGISATETTYNTVTTVNEKRALGIKYAEDVYTNTYVQTVTKTYRLL